MLRAAVCLFVVVLILGVPALAQGGGAASQTSGGFKAEFLLNLKDAGDKVISLAEAVPAEKYSWRPSEGVMSFAEVCAHVVESNLYYLQRATSQKPPETIDLKALKATPDKEKAVEALRASLDLVQQVVQALPDAQFDRTVKIYGDQTRTVRAVLLGLVSHVHEHLGQSIAYARMNGVVPPWSQKQ